jgi:hypothetical protein
MYNDLPRRRADLVDRRGAGRAVSSAAKQFSAICLLNGRLLRFARNDNEMAA